MKRLPEKMMIAAIILSCGFVMQSDPPQPSHHPAKDAERAELKRLAQRADASRSEVGAASDSTGRADRAPW